MSINGKQRGKRPDDAGLVRAARSVSFAAAILADGYIASLKGDGRTAQTKAAGAGEFLKEAQREIALWRGKK